MSISEKEYKWMVEMMTSDLVKLLMDREGYEFSKAFDTVYNSDTYKALLNPETMFYYQSPGYVFEFLKTEIKTGKMG